MQSSMYFVGLMENQYCFQAGSGKDELWNHCQQEKGVSITVLKENTDTFGLAYTILCL